MTDFKVSVIIPLAPNEKISIKLAEQLLSLPNDWEILFCSPKLNNIEIIKPNNTSYIIAQSGRANCLNEGAKHASGEYLWFLHADSFLADGTFSKLIKIIENNIRALYYFDLAFYTSSCRLIKLNEWGVLFRCRCLKTPFGDQGFFIKKSLFDELGNYSTNVAYGEDHLLVRNFRRNNIPIKPIGVKLYTSARKYELHGWFKTTMKHLYLWLKQAVSDEKVHRKELRNENCSSNILQNPGHFSRENSFSIGNRQKTGGDIL